MFDFIRRAVKAGYTLQNPAALEWAVWLHDVIYDPNSSSNEADSAVLAAQLLQPAGVQPETISKKYLEYATAVRQEYSHLDDKDYTRGRARVLKALLDREQLFLTDIGKSAFEAEARANMTHEWRLVFGESRSSLRLSSDLLLTLCLQALAATTCVALLQLVAAITDDLDRPRQL
eukprot:gene3133-3411_t